MLYGSVVVCLDSVVCALMSSELFEIAIHICIGHGCLWDCSSYIANLFELKWLSNFCFCLLQTLDKRPEQFLG